MEARLATGATPPSTASSADAVEGFVTTQDVRALSAGLHEPQWLLELRLEAWDTFQRLPLPGEREEAWRYLDLARMRFAFRNFSAARLGVFPTSTQRDGFLSASRAGYLVQREADVVHQELSQDLLDKGVICCDLHTAVRQHEDLVRKYLFSEVNPHEHKFAALQAALWTGGTFVYVPRGVEMPLPIESQRWIETPGIAIFPHTLVVVEEGAQASYVERFECAPLGAPALAVCALELVAKQASRINYICVQHWSQDVYHFQTQRTVLERDVNAQTLVATLGGLVSRMQVETVLNGPRASSEMLGVYFADGHQHLDHRTLQDHAAPQTHSDLLHKGAVKHRSRSVWAGLIRVRPDAQKTDAYQSNRNLVLSEGAHAESKPDLEIEANDVRCTHGSTIGPMDDDQIFYVMSRGINSQDAQRLIVRGHFAEVFERIRVPEVAALLAEEIERKIAT